MESYLLWKFYVLCFVVVLILGGCESDQTTTNSGRVSPGLNDYPTTRPAVNNRLSTEEFLEQHRKTWNPDKVIEPTTPPTSAPIPVKPSGKPFDNGRPYPTPTPPKWSISGNSATASAKAEAQTGIEMKCLPAFLTVLLRFQQLSSYRQPLQHPLQTRHQRYRSEPHSQR